MKKIYSEPQLTVFGSVETLTQKVDLQRRAERRAARRRARRAGLEQFDVSAAPTVSFSAIAAIS